MGRKMRLSAELTEILDKQFSSFKEKFGREPGPSDPLFFDPDADTPQQLTDQQVNDCIRDAALADGLDPARVFRRIFPNDPNPFDEEA